MAITYRDSRDTVHWLSRDVGTGSWLSLLKAAKDGVEGQEIDTGKQFYMQNDAWVEWFSPEVLAIRQMQTAVVEILENIFDEIADYGDLTSDDNVEDSAEL